jgi:DNA repair exonuclease SbcCD ATPase subunit
MKIQRMKLENFRSYLNLDIELPGRITVLRGPNHAGKSTIEEAIQYGLAARSASTTAAGAGYDETLMRNGCDTARIFLDLLVDGDLSKLRATITRKSGRTLATRDAEGADTTAEMNPWLRNHAEIICCLTNSRYFVDLEPAKQKDILSAIVLPATYDGWDPEMVKASESLGGESAAFFHNEHPFTVISKLYDWAFELRKNINRDLKSFVSPGGDISDAGEVEEIREKLRTRRAELTALQSQRAKLLADSEACHARRSLTQKRIENAERKLTEETRSMTEHQASVLDKQALKANQHAASQAKHAGDLDAQVAAGELELKTLTAAINKVDALTDKCPTCEQTITEAVKDVILQPLAQQYEAVAATLRKAREARASVPDYTLAAQALKDHAAAEKEVIRTGERLKEAQAELAGATHDLEAIAEAAAVDTTALDEQIAEHTARIEKGTTRLTQVTAANERKAAQDAAAVRLAALKEQAALLGRLVAYFGPSGVQATLLQEHVGAFVVAMNEVLAAWGYTCALRFTPSFFFGIITPPFDDQTEWSLRTLSKSERYRFAIAFQVALAMQSGFRFVVIDEMDMLDKEGRGGLMQKIIASGLDQAILVGTDERDTISPGMGEAADYFMVSSALIDGIPTSSVARLHASV